MNHPELSIPPMMDTPVGNAMFLRNMHVLWRVDPELAMRVDEIGDDKRFELMPTSSGRWTARVLLSGGQTVFLHSRHDPVAEARALIDTVPMEAKPCFVVSGLGLGYHVRELCDRLRRDAVLICVEPSLPLVATAMTCTDFSDLLRSRRLILLTDGEKAHLHERLKDFSTLMMLGTQFVQHAPSLRVADDAHRRIAQSISEFITYMRMSLLTLVTNAKITCRNIAMNLVHYVSTPPINELRNRFAGCAGVVISAGPSLGRNLEQLAQLRGRAVLCAVQTALKPLMERGIVPDFVTSLDYHEMSWKFFDTVSGLEAVHLVAEPKATWHVLDNYPGPVSLLDNHWARLLVGDGLAGRDGLKAGATVAHLAFYLAVYLGCDPIIFVGQDLAFTGHVFYVPGVEVHRAWRSELNRFSSIEQKEWERIARNRPILRRVKSAGGGEVYTDELLLTYLEQFEKDIAQAPVRVINATEGGAHIRGTREMSLLEASETFCAAPIDPQRFAYRSTMHRRDTSRWPEACRELEARIVELDQAEQTCDEILVILKELEGLTSDPIRFNQRLVRVDDLRAQISRESRTYRIINAATQLAELKRFSDDRRISAVDKRDEVERARQQIARDTTFIQSVREGIGEVRPMLRDALDRMEKAIDPP